MNSLNRKPDGFSLFKYPVILTIAGSLLLLLILEIYFANQSNDISETAAWESTIDDSYNQLVGEYPMINYGSYFALEPGIFQNLWGRPFRTNQQGFRSPELRQQNNPNTIRIGIMGTCVSLGELDTSMDGYSNITSAMKEILQREYPDLEFEVLNASVPGSYERQHLEHYRAVLRALEFDMLFLEVGTTQIIDPKKMLKIYRDNPQPGRAMVPNSIATPLHDFFARSALIRKLYDFQTSQEQLFDQHFRGDEGTISATTTDGAADLVESFDNQILMPSVEHYRRQLADLLMELSKDLPIIAFTFSHALPAVSEGISTNQFAHLTRTTLVRGVSQVLDRDVDAKLDLFNRSFSLVDEINTEITQSTEFGGRVTYVPFDSFPTAKSYSNHHPKYYFLSVNEGSRIRGQILANQLIDNGWLETSTRLGVTE